MADNFIDSTPKAAILHNSRVSSDDETYMPSSKDGFRTIKSLEGSGDETAPDVRDDEVTGLIGDILAKYERCKTERLPHETRMLRQYHNFRGMYGQDVRFRDTEQSRAFVKITKTKVFAAYGQIMEILFQGSKFPISVEPSDRPQGIAEYAHLDPNPNAKPTVDTDDQFVNPYGWDGDGKELAPGTTYHDLLGGLKEQLGPAELTAGPSPDEIHMPQIEPAKMAAEAMEKAILNQINQSDGHIWLRKAVLEMCMLGSGVIKGPFSTEQILHNWIKDEDTGEMRYSPMTEKVPSMGWTSVWNFYPDPDAKIMKEAEFAIERHKLSRSDLRALARRPLFRRDAIARVLQNVPNYTDQWYEYQLRDSPVNVSRQRYEVLEYWGIVDKQLVESTGIDLGEKFDDLDEVQVNVWLCNHEILRLVLNPFTPANIPYHLAPYEEHEYQMWGVGVAENMEDSQEIMNAFARLAIDNAVLAGSLVFDIDEQSLVPGQDMKIYPGKIFRRQAGAAGQAVFGLKFPNTATDNMQIFDKFRQLADESTGIPSYTHGQTGVTSSTRTSSGLSMLMGAAALNIKGVIKNIDDFMLQPLGEAYFHWNMQFNEDESIRGDITIKARGTSGLMAKEIKSQRLMQFLQLGANPALAPFIKSEHIIREIAIALDLDPDEVTNDPTMAAIYAKIIGTAGGMQQSGSPQSMDASGVGGANIGQGNVPSPGQSGFTGNSQGGSGGNSSNAESANA